MTGFNLPPGCNVSDIPGNRPEDERWEKILDKFWNGDNCTDELWKKFETSKLDSALMDIVDKAIQFGMDIAENESQLNREQNRFYHQQHIEDTLTKERVYLKGSYRQAYLAPRSISRIIELLTN